MNQLQERIQPEAALPTPHVSRQERQEELRRQLEGTQGVVPHPFPPLGLLAHDAVAGTGAVGPITFLGVAAALGLALTITTLYSPSNSVTVDGQRSAWWRIRAWSATPSRRWRRRARPSGPRL